MIKSTFLMLLLILLLFFNVSLYALDKSKNLRLYFVGNHALGYEQLVQLINTKKKASLLSSDWQEKGVEINPIYLSKLDELYTFFYRQEGFYDVNITHHLRADGDVVLYIQEHQPVKVAQLSIESDHPIEELIAFHQGDRFRAKRFSEMKRSIIKALLKEGYCGYDLDTKAYVDLESHQVSIKIKLAKGEVCHFGKVTITGDKNISQAVVLSRLHFEEGDRFDLDKIKESYESLYALDAFDNIQMVYDAKFHQKIPLDVRFKSMPPKISSRIGVGYATDLRFQAKYHWEYKNFYGNARKLRLDALFSQKQKNLESNFFNPAVRVWWGYHLDFQNTLGYQAEEGIHEFDEVLLFDKFFLEHQENQWIDRVGIGVEHREILGDKEFLLIYPFAKVVLDLRDSKINPTEGIYFSHEMEYGLPYTPESTTYFKYLDELRLIYTLDQLTLSAVGRVGGIMTYQNRLPESKKFFAGGAFSNRAYGYEQIGVTISSTEDLNEGGDGMVNLSFEMGMPLYKRLYLGIFSDNTMISDRANFWEFSNPMIHSVGMGLRYMTPIGPFKIDFGFNLHQYDENALHFQIGQSF